MAEAAPPRARPVAPVRRPVRDRDDEDEDDEDDRPRRRRKPRKKGSNTLLYVLGAVGLVLVLGCAGGGVWLASAFNKPMTFAESDWREHALPDGGASVQCPVRMTPDALPSPGFGVTTHKDMWEAPGISDAAFAFGVIDCPLSNPSTLDTVYLEERDEVVRAVQGRVVSERALTVQGCPAKEFEFASGGASGVYRVVYVQGRTKKRFVLLIAGGRNMSAADRSRFIESFRLKSKP